MELNDFRARLKDGNVGGCFIFSGEEDYLKKHYLGELRKLIVDGGFDPFAHSVFDGAEVDFSALRESVLSPPMMADRKLVEWRYANFEKMKEGELELLEELLTLLEENPSVTLAFLVSEGDIDVGTPKRESKFAKRFGKRIGILDFARSTDVQLAGWLKKHFDAEGVRVGREEVEALIFRSGHAMTALHSETVKLSAYAKMRAEREGGEPYITVEDVQRVASSIPESETFALSNAILERNKRSAYLALEEMKLRRVDPLVIMGVMMKTYTDIANVSMMLKDGMETSDMAAATGMNPYRLKLYLSAARRFDGGRGVRILEELSRADVAAKFGGVSGYTAIDVFVARCV